MKQVDILEMWLSCESFVLDSLSMLRKTRVKSDTFAALEDYLDLHLHRFQHSSNKFLIKLILLIITTVHLMLYVLHYIKRTT